jgi:hypothetical protein
MPFNHRARRGLPNGHSTAAVLYSWALLEIATRSSSSSALLRSQGIEQNLPSVILGRQHIKSPHVCLSPLLFGKNKGRDEETRQVGDLQRDNSYRYGHPNGAKLNTAC